MERILSRGPARRLFSQFAHEWKITRKPKTKVIDTYEALPPWMTIQRKDPFDYPLRSLESVREYQKLNRPDFGVKFEFKFLINETESQRIKDRIVKLRISLDDMKLTTKQQERLIFLLGDRFKADKREVKIVVNSCETPEENMIKGLEILRELYFEALRAP